MVPNMTEGSFVVTGGAGFLGSHLCQALVTRGAKVLALDNLSSASSDNAKLLENSLPKDQFSFHRFDVTQDWTEIERLVPKSIAGVFHFASPASPPRYLKLPLETMAVNSLGTWRALRFAQSRGARLVFASTSEVYGDPKEHPQNERYFGNVNPVGPRSCYDEAKRFGETLIYTFNRQHKGRHGILRIFNTYGPQMDPHDGRVVTNFLRQALNGETLSIQGDGNQTRSFCFVSDLIDGVLKFFDSNLEGPMNFGNPVEFTMLELVDQIKLLFPEQRLHSKYDPLPQDDPKQRRPDITAAQEKLGWAPKVNLETGLRLTLDWMKSKGSVG